MKKKGYAILLGLTILFTLATLSTLIPQNSASKECFLGYRAHCTFTPFSAVVCIVIAGLLCVVRKRYFIKKN